MSLDVSVFAHADAWAALLTLTALEIVLGIDNVVFISITTDRLPPADQPRARRIGLILALVMRLGLLVAISWIMGLTAPLFTALGEDISGRDLILLLGGLFLIGKSATEIFDKLEVAPEPGAKDGKDGKTGRAVMSAVIFQIVLLDIVFSLDSVITAVGMAEDLIIMVIAVVIAVGVMLVFAGAIADFVNRRPSMKILALAFLLLIGVMLMAEGLGQHINKGYIYFAMAFALAVEMVNIRARGKQQPVTLGGSFERASSGGGGDAGPAA